MSKVTSTGVTDTVPASGASTRSLTVPNLNWKVDYAVTVDDANRGELTNLTTPIDQKETVVFSISNVPDIYKNTGIDPSRFSQVRQGVSLLAQVNETLRVTDTEVPDFEIDLPISAHLVVKVPTSQYVTTDLVQSLIQRLVATLADTDGTISSRLQSLLRGSMLPSSIR